MRLPIPSFILIFNSEPKLITSGFCSFTSLFIWSTYGGGGGGWMKIVSPFLTDLCRSSSNVIPILSFLLQSLQIGTCTYVRVQFYGYIESGRILFGVQFGIDRRSDLFSRVTPNIYSVWYRTGLGLWAPVPHFSLLFTFTWIHSVGWRFFAKTRHALPSSRTQNQTEKAHVEWTKWVNERSSIRFSSWILYCLGLRLDSDGELNVYFCMVEGSRPFREEISTSEGKQQTAWL